MWVCVLQEWVVLGQVDLEKLVEKHLNSVQDWERNFKALKARGKDSERLPRYILQVTNTMYQSFTCLIENQTQPKYYSKAVLKMLRQQSSPSSSVSQEKEVCPSIENSIFIYVLVVFCI